MRGARAILLACLASHAGCDVSRAPRDAPCSLTSDCEEPLVCADDRCRAQCREDRDCPAGSSCLPSGLPGARACLPPEAPVLCVYHSDCPVGTRCLERRCRLECREDRDCGEGRCIADAGTCDHAFARDALDAGFVPPPPDGALPPCASGRVRCANGCADLATSISNCGACGAACATNERCVAGMCECAAPFEKCGSACVDTRTDPTACGACFRGCTGPCHEGVCCGAGRGFCEGACVDLIDNSEHCGDCGVRCGEDRVCTLGVCAPFNNDDECEAAPLLRLVPGEATIVRGTTFDSAWHLYSGCAPGAVPGVRYRIELAERSLLYFSATGQGVYAGILSGGCDALGATCPDRRCVASDRTDATDWVHALDAGTHFLVVDAGDAATFEGRPFSMTLVMVPLAEAAAQPLPAGAFRASGRIDGGSDRPGSCAPGPEHALYWVSCDADPGGTLTADGAGAVLSIAGGTRVEACGAPDGTLTASLPPGPGLHVLFVDAPDATPLDYTVTGTRP